MRDQQETETVDQRITMLEGQVQALLEVTAAQAATIASLDRQRADATPRALAATAPTDIGRPIGRRHLLIGGTTATAVAAAAALVGTASPAAADNGGNLILGTTNTAASETKLAYSGTGNNGFRVEGGSSLAMIEGAQSGTAAGVKGMNSSSSGVAVEGIAAGGVGISGRSQGSAAIRGTSTATFAPPDADPSMGVGVEGQGVAAGVRGTHTGEFSPGGAAGVRGVSTGDGDGVHGESANRAGVVGVSSGSGSNAIVGVLGSAENGTGLVGSGRVGLNLYGDHAHLDLLQVTTRERPTSDTAFHGTGEVVLDKNGDLWLSTGPGTPGTWRKLGGPAAAGQFHILPTAKRVYDSRPGTNPSQGPKTKLSGNAARTLDITAHGSGVPADAVGVSVTLLLVNASSAGGNFTIWAEGSPRPATNNMVWGGSAGRFASTAITPISPTGKVSVAASASTDFVLDIVGYYR